MLKASLDPLPDQRGAQRHVLRLAAAIDARPGCAATVHNLSRTGLLVASEAALVKGEEIIVEFVGGARYGAEVVWADDGLLGCRFARPLSQGALSAALLRAPPSGPEPEPALPGDERASQSRVPAPGPGALTQRAKALIIGTAALLCWAALAGMAYLLLW